MKGATDKHSYCLISGTFSTDDASDLLMDLLQHKIGFHRRRIWSHSERFGEVDPSSEQRIEELKNAKAAISELLSRAAESGDNLTIRADIEISFTPG